MKQNKYIELVNNIPVDQEAPAKYPIKKFLLDKLRTIFANKGVIEQAKIAKKQEDLINAYKKSVGFDKKLSALRKAEAQVEKAEKALMEIGLNEFGNLLEMSSDNSYGQVSRTVRWHNSWLPVSKETAEKVEKVRELIRAVKGEMEPFTVFDQLETRLMMASTVGEAMAIINASTGEQVFKVKTELLGLPA